MQNATAKSKCISGAGPVAMFEGLCCQSMCVCVLAIIMALAAIVLHTLRHNSLAAVRPSPFQPFCPYSLPAKHAIKLQMM